jgi:hypothetical protein
MNAPVKTKSAVRGPHVDGPAEMWAGLLYFRHAADETSQGGDLQVGFASQTGQAWPLAAAVRAGLRAFSQEDNST